MLRFELSLTHFNPNSEIIVTSDASNFGIGTVICSKFNDDKMKTAVALPSKVLTTGEINLSQIVKEAIIIVFAEKKSKWYIIGNLFCKQIIVHYWQYYVLKSYSYTYYKQVPTSGNDLLNYNLKMKFLP